MTQKTNKKGNRVRCTRQTSEAFCSQHSPTPTEEPWEKEGLPVPHTSLAKRVTNRLRARLRRGPTKKDKEGWIYIFELPSDGKLPYYKIGRTTQDVEKRLRQWSKDAKLVASWKVSKNVYCEGLIHVYLDTWRMYRYETKKGLCSVWKDSGEAVTSRDNKLSKKFKLEGRKKQIEWFCGDISYFEKIATAVCALHSTSSS